MIVAKQNLIRSAIIVAVAAAAIVAVAAWAVRSARFDNDRKCVPIETYVWVAVCGPIEGIT